MQLKQERDENRCDPEVLRRVRNRIVAWGIPETNADELLEHYSMAAFSRGAVICQRGTPSDLLYWVCDGLVEIGYPLGDGDRIVMRLSGPGDVFGPLSLPDSAGRLTHAFEVRARTGCQVAFITNEQVSRILLTLEPKILVRLLEKTFVFWAEHAQHSAKFLAMDGCRLASESSRAWWGDRARRRGPGFPQVRTGDCENDPPRLWPPDARERQPAATAASAVAPARTP